MYSIGLNLNSFDATYKHTRCKQTTAVSTNVRRSLQVHVLTHTVQKGPQMSAYTITGLLRRSPHIRRHERYTLIPRVTSGSRTSPTSSHSPFLCEHKHNRLEFKPAECKPDRHRFPRLLMSTLLAGRPLQCDLHLHAILEKGRLLRSDDPYPR